MITVEFRHSSGFTSRFSILGVKLEAHLVFEGSGGSEWGERDGEANGRNALPAPGHVPGIRRVWPPTVYAGDGSPRIHPGDQVFARRRSGRQGVQDSRTASLIVSEINAGSMNIMPDTGRPTSCPSATDGGTDDIVVHEGKDLRTFNLMVSGCTFLQDEKDGLHVRGRTRGDTSLRVECPSDCGRRPPGSASPDGFPRGHSGRRPA
jgi:hypothetical protein